jgi:hypothetical protein
VIEQANQNETKHERKNITMKTNDLATIGAAALVTATLTVAIFLPASIEAGGDGDGLAAKIAQPKLVSHGVEITLTTVTNQTLKPGDKPVFELTLVNTTNGPADVAVRVAMTSMSPGGMVSRMGPMSQNLWEDQYTTTLKPNETKVVSLETNTRIPTNSTINVVLQSVDPTAPAVAANAPGVQVRQQPAVKMPSYTLQSVDANAGGTTSKAPMVQASQLFLPGPSAIVALSFSTRVPQTQPAVVAVN